MPQNEILGIELRLDVASWNRNIKKAERDADALEDSFDDAVAAAGRLEKEMNSLRSGSVDVDVNITGDDVQALQNKLTSIADEPVNIDLDIVGDDIAGLESRLDQIADETVNIDVQALDDEIGTLKTRLRGIQDEGVNIDVSVDDQPVTTLKSLLSGIADETVRITPSVDDGDIDAIRRRFDDLDNEAIKIKTEADLTGIDAIRGELETLKKLAIIDIVLGLPGNVAEIAQTIEGIPGVSALEDQQAAIRTLTARTGSEGERYADLIDELYTGAWGESRREIAEVIALSEQLGTTLNASGGRDTGSAVLSAYQTAAVTGQDVNDILRASNQLVDQGLVPNYENAADVIVAGFQNGANAADDFLDTLVEYGTTFRDLGLNGEQATNLLVSGLEAGFMNTDLAADALRELNIRLNEAVGLGTDEPANAALAQLGLENPRETGEEVGAEFLEGLFSAIAQSEGEMSQEQLLTALVGTQSEDLGAEAILALDAINERIGEVEGRAEEAATAITNDLATALTTLFREVESEIVTWLESDAVGLPGRIEAIKEDINETIALLNEGTPLDKAVEIAFELPGFATGVDRLESIFANLVLGLSDLVIGIADLTGNEGLAAGVRAARLPLAEQQLAFDLQIVEPESVVDVIDAALSRGVDPARAGELIQTAINEAVTDADFGQGINILESLLESNLGQDVPGARETIQNQLNALVQEAGADFTGAINEGDFDLAGTILESIEATDNAPFAAGMRRLLEDSFFSALDQADFTGATEAADALADPALTAQLDARVEQFRQIGESLLNQGNAAGAVDYAQMIGDAQLLAEAYEAMNQAAYPGIADSDGGMSIGAGTDVGLPIWETAAAGVTGARETFESETPLIGAQASLIQDDFLNIGASAEESLPIVSTEVALMSQNVIAEVTPANALLLAFIGNLNSAAAFSAGLDPNAAVAGATAGQPQTLDAGGPASAGVPYQVNGEIFIPPRDAYALGLPLSESLLGSLGGAGMGGSVTNTNITVNMINNNSGAAALVAGEGRLSNVIRGFA